MKAKTIGFGVTVVACLFALVSSVTAGLVPSTVFTYQGRLNVSGAPANGSFDLTFALFADENGGSQISATLTNTAVPVSNGLFMVNLDFGSSNYLGQAFWMQIGARTNGGSAFTLLNPLQQITPTPGAIYSLNAGTADVAGAATNLLGSVSPAQLSGTISAANLPSGILFNNAVGVSLSGGFTGNFSGDGSGLANVNSVISNTSNNPVEVEIHMPLPVYDVDNPTRHPFCFNTNVVMFQTNLVRNFNLFTVPADKKLAIECVSAFISANPNAPYGFLPPPPNQFQMMLQTSVVTIIGTNEIMMPLYNTNSAYTAFSFPANNGFTIPSLTQTIKAYADSSTPVLLTCFATNAVSYYAAFNISITGHLIDNTPPTISGVNSGNGGGSTTTTQPPSSHP